LKQPVDTLKGTVAGYFSDSVRYWEESYDDSQQQSEEFSKYAKNKRKKIVLAYLDAYARQLRLTVLDIGCGPGVFMQEAARRGHRISGIDISNEMLGRAKDKLKQYDGLASCQQADIENMPFGNETSDVVMCLGVLPYLRNDRGAIKEIDRVLKRGGMVIIVLSNLMKLGNVLDPYYYLVRIWQYLWYMSVGKRVAPFKAMDTHSFGKNRVFNIRRHRIQQARAMFSSYGKVPEENITPIEYGPLTFWRRKLLPDNLSIKLSEWLSGLSCKWTWLKTFSNEWVICSIKQPAGNG
jgi:ubiquinone/menaquinone biosynthesis C-methylase UbiE